MMHAPRFPILTLVALSGLIIWGIHFTLVYGFNALACAFEFAEADLFGIGVARLAVLFFGAAALVALAGANAFASRGRLLAAADQKFLRALTTSIIALSGLAVIWETIPALILSPCG